MYLLTENSSLPNTEYSKQKNDYLYNRNLNTYYQPTEEYSYQQTAQKSIKKNRIYEKKITNEKKKSNYNRMTENSKECNNNLNAIYMNNYKPKKKKFKVIRNESDITNDLSRSHKRNEKNFDDFLNDCDTASSNNSKKNNIFYLINLSNFSFINDNLKNINKENKNTKFYRPEQKISKISLPFCVYEHTFFPKKQKQNACKNKNCPGCFYCLGIKDDPNNRNKLKNDGKGKKLRDIYNIVYPKDEDKLSTSFDDNQTGNYTPNFLKPHNDRIPKKKDNFEENEDDIDTFDIDSSVGTELSKRGDISVHCINNIITFPKEFFMNEEKRKNSLNKRNKRKILSKKDKKGKNKSDIQIKQEEDINKFKDKSKSEPKNKQYPKIKGFTKVKKFELLRDFD